MASHRTVDLSDRPDVPGNLRDLISNIPLVVPDGVMEGPTRIVYERAMDGRCMTCATEVGALTAISMSSGGILALHCTVKCMVDQQLMGWLEETYDDLKQAVEFRGSVKVKPDEPEEEHDEEGNEAKEGQQTGDDPDALRDS